jgi:hypothetical protein
VIELLINGLIEILLEPRSDKRRRKRWAWLRRKRWAWLRRKR